MEAPGPIWRVGISEQPLQAAELLSEVGDPGAGAVILFLGTARNQSAGKTDISHLEYEAYPELVEQKLAEIAQEAVDKWPVIRMAVMHRTGEVAVGETSVAVAVSTAHRHEAFEVGRYVIDELKKRAPIWKKEHWEGGGEWVQGA